jgi:hypothetical protein
MANSASLLRYASLPGLGSRSIPHQSAMSDEHLASYATSVDFLSGNDVVMIFGRPRCHVIQRRARLHCRVQL